VGTLEPPASHAAEFYAQFDKQHGFFSVEFSPDGKRLAAANWDGSLMMWKLRYNRETKQAEGDLIYSISRVAPPAFWQFWGIDETEHPGHQNSVDAVTFNPEGDLLASASFDNTIKLWSAEDGQLIRTLRGHQDWVMDVAFSDDGQRLVSTGEDRTVRVWEVSTGDLLLNIAGHLAPVHTAAFSRNQSFIASGGQDMTVRLWETASGALLATLDEHVNYINTVTFSPNGKWLASASGDDTVLIWSTVADLR